MLAMYREARILLALGLLCLCTFGTAAVANALTWVTNPANSHQYAITEIKYWGVDKTQTINTPTVLDAEVLAVSLGGHLVTVNDAAENAWLLSTFGVANPGNPNNLLENFWIGLNDLTTEGTFVWFSGEPVTYTNWASTEPSNDRWEDVVAIDHPSVGSLGKWNDLGALMLSEPGPHYGVIEIDPATPAPGASWGAIKAHYR